MPTGSRARGFMGGFTYLLLLFALAIGSAGLAALGGTWATAAQRARETELLFRGGEFSRAFASYQRTTPAGGPPYPLGLEELLEDRRGPVPAHHLRRLYADPFTGVADWVMVREGERVRALRSRSPARLFRLPPGAAPNAVVRAFDLEFGAAESPAASPNPSSLNRPEAEPKYPAR